MAKSFWSRLRTNLPCLSVAMNSTLTSSTRFLMVRTESPESGLGEVDAANPPLGAKYDTCARSGNPATARNSPASKKYFPVYFIPHPVPTFGVSRRPPRLHLLIDARNGPKAAARCRFHSLGL